MESKVTDKVIWRTQSQINPIKLSSEDEWFNYRCGKITASEIWKIMGKGKTRDALFTQIGYTYILQNVAEIITGDQKKIADIKALEWGKRFESDAVALLRKQGYSFDHYGGNNKIFYPYNKFSGASPDGLSERYIFEIKCPYTKENHIMNLIGSASNDPVDFLRRNRFEYLMQIYFNMLCTGRNMGYFVSYDPRPLAVEHRLAIIEVPADEKVLIEMDRRVEAAKDIIKEYLELLNKLKREKQRKLSPNQSD